MRTSTRSIFSFLFVFLFSATFWTLQAQSNSGFISGTVTDPSGAVVPGATVTIENQVSGYPARQDGWHRTISVQQSTLQPLPSFGDSYRASAAWRKMPMCGPQSR